MGEHECISLYPFEWFDLGRLACIALAIKEKKEELIGFWGKRRLGFQPRSHFLSLTACSPAAYLIFPPRGLSRHLRIITHENS